MSFQKNIKLIIEYDGLGYQGWQRQLTGPTVQEVIEAAIAKMVSEKVALTASGRTDSGVHAKCQIANFFTNSDIPPESFKKALNSLLPPDIAIIDASYVPLSFHSRHAARMKHYRYRVLSRGHKSAFEHPYSWFIPYKLDIEKMTEGGKFLVGELDFSSFRSSSCEAKSTIKTIYSIDIFKEGDIIIFDIKGDGFLKQMVRNIVGTLISVGCGKIAPEGIKKILEKKDRRAAGPTAPAKGLSLMEIVLKDY